MKFGKFNPANQVVTEVTKKPSKHKTINNDDARLNIDKMRGFLR